MWVTDGLGVMSIGFMLPQQDNAVIWRGPKKNGLIKQFLTVRELPPEEREERLYWVLEGAAGGGTSPR